MALGWGRGADTEGHPGLSPKVMPTLRDFIENKEPAKKTEEMSFKAGRKPIETCHDLSEREHSEKAGVAY